MGNSLTKGLFRGPLLLKVSITSLLLEDAPDQRSQAYRALFLGRTHAFGVAAKTKSGNAKIHGMTLVIPSTICYAAIQVNQRVVCSLHPSLITQTRCTLR